MASVLCRNLRFCSFHRFKQLEGILGCTGLHHYQFGNQSNGQKNYFGGNRTIYGILGCFASISLILYSCKDKLKISTSWIPIVYALEKNDNSLRKRFNFIADVVEKSADAVVCIGSKNMSGFNASAGSGFIITEDGLILTNAHVVMNRPHRTVQVKLKDGRTFPGEIEFVDSVYDLATIRVKANNLPVMQLGSSSDLRAGEWVVAIGSPLSLSDSVSAGVVSSPQRKGEDIGMMLKDRQYIQTDAAITFGNSGGPLVNLDGEAVGVNSMKVTPGISFAIPIEYAKEFLKRSEELRKDRKGGSIPNPEKRSYIGVSALTLTPEVLRDLNNKYSLIPEVFVNGALVCQVIIDSPAAYAGLRPGDIIVEINGKPVEGVQSVYNVQQPGIPMHMKIYRQNVPLIVIVTPVEIS